MWTSGGTNAADGDLVLALTTAAIVGGGFSVRRRVRRQVTTFLAVARACRAERPAALHANTTSAALLVALVGRLMAVPRTSFHVRDPHLGRRQVAKLTVALMVKRSAVVLPSGRALPSVPKSWTRLHFVTSLRVVPNAVRGPSVAQSRLAAPPLKIVVVVGSGKLKAADVVADVVRSTADLALEWHVFGPRDDIPPDGWLARQLAIARASVGERFIVHSRVTGLVDELQHFHLALLPSRDESFGRVAVEAAAAGVLPVWARNVGFSSSLGDCLFETSFPVDDAEAAAAVIRRLAGSPELRRDLGERLPSISERFTPSQIAWELTDVWFPPSTLPELPR